MQEVDLDFVARRATVALQARHPAASVGTPEPLEGGHSGLTLVADLQGVPNSDRIVLKLAPPGRPAVGRHDVVRQARLIQHLSGQPGVAVPPILFVDASPAPLVGMGWVEGDCIEPILDEHTLPPGEVHARALDAARLLGALHAIPTDTLPSVEHPTSPEGELDRWVPTMEAIDPALRPRAPQLQAALRTWVPLAVQHSVLHGDFRLGNILAADGQARALIDWEIWSVGDPRVDLGWFLVFSDPHNLPGSSHPCPGMPDAGTLRTAYAATGASVADAAWFDALARYKMAAIMGHNLKRHREGRYHDPYQERNVDNIVDLVDQGLQLLS